jgi:hypothetical protein
MMICPNLKCRKVLQVPAKYRGQQVKCHYCNSLFAVPMAKVADAPTSKKPADDSSK